MANPQRGEFVIDVGGKSYTLAAGTNTLAAAEGLFSTSEKPVTWQEICNLAARNSMRHIRGILWAMLRKHHREMTLEETGELVDSVGLHYIDGKLSELIAQTVPDPKDLHALGIVPGNPLQAQPTRKDGTGARSSRKRGRSG